MFWIPHLVAGFFYFAVDNIKKYVIIIKTLSCMNEMQAIHYTAREGATKPDNRCSFHLLIGFFCWSREMIDINKEKWLTGMFFCQRNKEHVNCIERFELFLDLIKLPVLKFILCSHEVYYVNTIFDEYIIVPFLDIDIDNYDDLVNDFYPIIYNSYHTEKVYFFSEYEELKAMMCVENGADYDYYFCSCDECGYIGIEFNGRSDRLGCKNKKRKPCTCSTHGDKGYNYRTKMLLDAYRRAGIQCPS